MLKLPRRRFRLPVHIQTRVKVIVVVIVRVALLALLLALAFRTLLGRLGLLDLLYRILLRPLALLGLLLLSFRVGMAGYLDVVPGIALGCRFGGVRWTFAILGGFPLAALVVVTDLGCGDVVGLFYTLACACG